MTVACQDSEFKGYNGGGGATDKRTDTPTNSDVSTDTRTTEPTNPLIGQTPVIPIDPATPELPINPKGFDVEFSKPGTVWHLGDNAYPASSCKFLLNFNKIDGKSFNFNFFVERDGTRVDIEVNHCGIDSHFANQHPVALFAAQGANALLSKKLPSSENLLFMSKEKIATQTTLNRGWYKLRVDTSSNPQNGDFDDFLIGKVRFVNATGPITIGEVTQN